MPSASQYVELRRLQAGINGRLGNTKPSSKRGSHAYDRFAGSTITTLPPNALMSNKFIQIPSTSVDTMVVIDRWSIVNSYKRALPNKPVPAGSFILRLRDTVLPNKPILYLNIVFNGDRTIGLRASIPGIDTTFSEEVEFHDNETSFLLSFRQGLSHIDTDVIITGISQSSVVSAVYVQAD